MILDFSQNSLFVIFEITEDNNVTLNHFSKLPPSDKDKIKRNSLISDINIFGSKQDGRFGAKHIGESEITSLKYKKHNYYANEYGNKLEFLLSNSSVDVVAHYQFYNGIPAVRSWKTVINNSKENVGLEYVSSFSYTGISEDNLKLYIPHNSWCSEADWEEFTPSQLGFKKYQQHTSKRISVSNTDSWSTEEYLPMGAAVSNNDAIMWQIENNGSWQWEIGDVDDMLYLKMSGPTEQENFWYKELLPGEAFEGVKACVCVGRDFNDVLKVMTSYRRQIINNEGPDKKLPVIFNDYMHCIWADPTEEKILPLIDRAAELGCEYYCMDAGWYADGTWWDTVGDWKEQKKRFPNGIKNVFDYIKSKGMHPGIWLEIEVMGIYCPILDEFDDDCFFVRHGKRVVNRGRYLLDFRNEKVRSFASDTVARVVEEYGAEYIKIDYNVTTGAGTEIDSDSLGDGLLEHNRAYLDWIREIKHKYPDLILENCGSGGLRMDYAMLSEYHLQSLTDQSDYKNITHIAAAAPTAVLPEQSGIWACPLAKNNCDDVAVSITNGLLQRLYLSGQIHELDADKLALVKEGIRLHKKLRKEIPDSIPFYPMGLPNHLDKIICLGFKYKNCRRIALWCFEDTDREIVLPIDYSSAEILYPSDTRITISHEEGGLKANIPAECSSVIIELI